MTIADPATLETLITRLRALRSDSERRWGTLEPGEMLCHIADTNDVMLFRPDPSEPIPQVRARPILKWLVLNVPLPRIGTTQTHPGVDPRRDGTKPGDFEADRERAVDGLHAVAAAAEGELYPVHFLLGPMSTGDWQRSTWRHIDLTLVIEGSRMLRQLQRRDGLGLRYDTAERSQIEGVGRVRV